MGMRDGGIYCTEDRDTTHMNDEVNNQTACDTTSLHLLPTILLQGFDNVGLKSIRSTLVVCSVGAT